MRREGLSSRVAMRQRLGLVLKKNVAQITKRQAGIQNVLDNQHVFTLDGLIEVLE